MMKKIGKAIGVATAFFVSWSIAASVSAGDIETLEALKEAVTEIHNKTHSTALGVAVVDRGQVVWVDAMGMADAELQRPATPENIFPVGSIAKMLVSLSVLQLVNEGKLDLQMPLRELAPEIQHHNRWEDQEPVRLTHLLEHTAGWSDMSFAEYSADSGEFPHLKEALFAYPDRRRSRWVPGTRMAYTNIGPAVAAYIVQKTSGLAFERYIRENLLSPLEMHSTSFTRPSDDQLAYPHINGLKQTHKRSLYPASGPLYASPEDMAKLLQFFVNRGKPTGTQHPLLPDSLIQRMETPKTTLASAKGVTAGYGLGNRSAGFRHYGIDFHGHDGRVPGAMATFYYAPSLNSGYFLALTGDSSGARDLANAVRAYLLRNRPNPSSEQPPLPENTQALIGTYQPINPSVDFMSFVPAFFNAVRLSTHTNTLRLKTLGGGEQKTFAVDHNKSLIDLSSGLPSIATVTDPLAGDSVQIESTLYQRVSDGWVWAELLYWLLLALSSVLAVIMAVVWIPLRLFRKSLFQRSSLLPLCPALSSLTFLTGALYPLLNPLNITRITPWSLPATFLFGVTLAYAIFTVLGVLSLVTLRKIQFGKVTKTAITASTLLHASMALYLSTHGIIGMRLWTW